MALSDVPHNKVVILDANGAIVSSTATPVLAAGEAFVGFSGTPMDFTTHSPVVSTSIYTTGFVLWETISLGNIARVADGKVSLQHIAVLDEDDEKAAMDLLFFHTTQSIGTVNNAASLTDANSRDLIGAVSIVAGDYIDMGGVSVATIRNVGLVCKPTSLARTIHCAAIVRGTPTYTASTDIRLRCGWFV